MKLPSSKRAFAVLCSLFLQAAAAFGAITINTQPANVAVADATKITLSVSATGGNPLTYTWKKRDGLNVTVAKPEGTSNQFVIASSKTTDAGVYFVTIRETGTVNTADSTDATVTVNVRPKITVHPTAPAIPPTEGATVNFSVTLDPSFGTAPFTYTWQKKTGTTYNPFSGPLTKADRNDTLTLNNVQLSSAGTYRVVVTNASNINILSKDVILKVNTRPVITTQPAANFTVVHGAAGPLKVVVGGNPPFTYKWFKNDVEIPKTNSPTLSIKGTDNTAAGVAEGPGTYKVRITNSFTPDLGQVTEQFTESANSVVRVIRKPKIVTQPLKLTKSLMAGPNSADFSVVMDTTGDEGALQYQWYKDNKIMVGQTNSTLSFPVLAWTDRGSYKVIIKNEVGTVTSASAVLTIISPPIITSQSPAELYGATKGSLKLFVVATGTTPLTYEWQFKPVAAGAYNPAIINKTANLTLSNLSNVNHHGYYKCTVKNAPPGGLPAGILVSAEIYVQVDDAPKITQQTTVLPYDGTITKGTPNIPAGKKLNLKITATGTNRPADVGDLKQNPLVFKWLKNGVVVPGQTTNELLIDPAAAGDSGKYACEVSNLVGKVLSTSVTITVSGPPSVTVQPNGATGIEESRVETTAVTAVGTGLTKYEWEKQSGADWLPVTGQVSNKLILVSAQIINDGVYRCRVYNAFGSNWTDPVTINILPIPSATLGPVAGLSTREFFPRVARSGEKVRIFGTNLQYTSKVEFGAGNVGNVTIESQNSILVTVPLGAPLADNVITVTTKGKLASSIGGGTTNTAGTFRRTTDYENSLPDSTILTISQGKLDVVGNDATLAASDPIFGRAYYILHLKKKSIVQIYLGGGITPNGPVEMDLDVYLEVNLPPGPSRFAGPDGVTQFPNAAQSRSFLIGDDQVTITTTEDDVNLLIVPYSGFAVLNSGYVNFGPFNMSVIVQPTTGAASSEPDVSNLTSGSKWEASDRTSASTQEREDGTETISFGGATDEGAAAGPVSLWQPESGTSVSSGTVVSSFNMSLEPGNADGDDQFAWQVTGADGSPLMAMWLNAADGTLRVVQPDGTTTDSIQHVVPGGGAHRFEVSVNLDDDTWITLMDGVPVTEPIKIPAGATFGDISAVWDLGADKAASGASINFSNFRVDGVSTTP